MHIAPVRPASPPPRLPASAMSSSSIAKGAPRHAPPPRNSKPAARPASASSFSVTMPLYPHPQAIRKGATRNLYVANVPESFSDAQLTALFAVSAVSSK